jgi:phage gpG-like protein
MRFTVEILGGEKVDVALSRFGDAVRDMRPFWIEAFAPQFYKDQVSNFESEGGYVGKWAPLSPGYARYKQMVRPGRPIMVFNGDLRASLTSGRHRGSVFQPLQQSLKIGTSIPYAPKHHFGDGRLPQRRLIWLASSQTYGRLAHRWAVQKAKQAGLRVA